MVASSRGRIEVMEQIVNVDMDVLDRGVGSRNLWNVKDALLRHVNCADELPDVLARRYWAKAALKRLERARAVGLWLQLKDRAGDVPLERLCAAYDMFVDGLEDADCHDVTTAIDDLAARFKADNPTYDEWTPRELARTIAQYLRSQGFKGTEETFYHNLPNNFIARCLRNSDHPALPIVCVTIYCALAQRLGLDASPCGFPMHVYAVVTAPAGRTLDNRSTEFSPELKNQRMYIDAFRPEIEAPVSHLRTQLQSMGLDPSSNLAQNYLGPATNAEIILRSSRNIMHSVRVAQNRPTNAAGIRTGTEGWPDIDESLYAALWVLILLHQFSDADDFEQRRNLRKYLPFVVETMQRYFPWDVSLFEDFVLPVLVGTVEYRGMAEILTVVRRADAMRKPKVIRGENTEMLDGNGEKRVRFSIGTVFRHKRFNYMGVIIGWDVSCEASEEWKTTMNIKGLERGENQSFYHIL